LNCFAQMDPSAMTTLHRSRPSPCQRAMSEQSPQHLWAHHSFRMGQPSLLPGKRSSHQKRTSAPLTPSSRTSSLRGSVILRSRRSWPVSMQQRRSVECSSPATPIHRTLLYHINVFMYHDNLIWYEPF
jgi:hypothetical protein